MRYNRSLSFARGKRTGQRCRNERSVVEMTQARAARPRWDEDAVAPVLEKLRFDGRGLIPAIAQQHDSREVLMLGWMSPESPPEKLPRGQVCYLSRSRAPLWPKGETSG